MRIAVVEPVGRGGLIHYAFQLCRGLAEEGAAEGVEVTLVTGRPYELEGLDAPFRVEPVLRLWDPKPAAGPREEASSSLSHRPPREEASSSPTAAGVGHRSRVGADLASARGEGTVTAGTRAESSSAPTGAGVGHRSRVGADLASARGEGTVTAGTRAESSSSPTRAGGWTTRQRVCRVLRRAVRGARWYREQARLVAHLRRLRPDVVQLGDLRFGADLLPLAALRASGLRLADVCHNVRPFAAGGRQAGGFGAGRLSRALYRRAYRRFDVVFVHGEGNRRRFVEAWGVEPRRVRSIPLGGFGLFEELRDPAATPEGIRRRLGLAPGEPVVLFFGTLARYKGVDLLVEAFARLRARVPEARLVVAGFPLPGPGGVTPGELRSRARRLGAGDAVRVVPEYLPSGEVAAWMELAAAAVFPYREVSQSAALQVAASFGVPLVATAVGGTAEVVRDGETGLLVPAGEGEETLDALAGALERLLRDRELARRLGRRAAEEARTRGSWRGVAREVLAAYRELLPAGEGGG